MKKILFIDEPFSGATSLRATRSGYLWDILSTTYDADLLLLKSQIYLDKPVAAHYGYDKLYSLSLDTTKKLLPESYHKLASGQAERFASILDSKRYELIVFAGLSCLPLARIASKILPHCKIAVDVEATFTPGLENAWNTRKKVENYQALWGLLRQKMWDSIMLNPTYHYFLSNPSDESLLLKTRKVKPINIFTAPLPIIQNNTEPLDPVLAHTAYILFWGEQPGTENIEVAKIICSDIYPRISQKMVEKNLSLVLCGEEKLSQFCGGRIVYAHLTDLPALLQHAMLVLLPLLDADREGRIIKTAQASKALVCSQAALTAMPLPEGTCLMADSTEVLADKLIGLFRTPKQIAILAESLQEHCLNTYKAETLKTELISTINTWMAGE